MGSTVPAPHKFSRKLHEVFGDEAAEAMVEWMNRTDEKLDKLEHDLALFRQEVAVGFAKVDVAFAKVESAAAQRHAELAQRHADLMKWMLTFWAASLVTYVGAIVALAKVIR